MKLLTEGNFDAELSDATWVVNFWASWCGPCLDTKHLEDLELTTPGVKVGRVNVEENKELANLHGVIIVPTYILFSQGQPVKRLVGLQTTSSLLEMLKS